MQEENKIIRSYQIVIKKGHKMFNYFDNMSFLSKNLYNITNFYIRQAFIGLKKSTKEITENEKEVINIINSNIVKLNDVKQKYYEKRLKGFKKDNSKKEPKKPKFFNLLDSEHCFPSYEMLEGVFKITKQIDYKSLPSHSNQHIMKQLYQDYESFFSSIKEYNVHPEKFKAKPKIPKYAPKDGRKIVIFSNQTCVIKNDKYLKFPKTKDMLNIDKLGFKGSLKEVRVVPRSGNYIVEVVTQLRKDEPQKSLELNNIVSIDLGVDNFVTIVNNIGLPPVLVKGNIIKSINQQYNKLRADYYSKLRMGMEPKEGQFTSKKLQRITFKRNSQIKDYMHKVSRFVVNYCVANNIGTLVVGKNKSIKNEINIGGVNNQNFVLIPHALFIDILTYKCQEVGINIIITEESYTSKASFLDLDEIPVYKQGDKTKYTFSGKRIHRGLYKSKNGILINADVNGAYNILRKVNPQVFAEGVAGFVSTPAVITIKYPKKATT